jgi:hypothetical protein
MHYMASPPENALWKLKNNFIARSKEALASLDEIYQAGAIAAREEIIMLMRGSRTNQRNLRLVNHPPSPALVNPADPHHLVCDPDQS